MASYRSREKRDKNHGEIVAALIAVGASVLEIYMVGGGAPDLLVGYEEANTLMEIKCEDGKRTKTQKFLSPDQIIWHNHWRGKPVVVVWCPEDALRAIGALDEVV